MDVGNFQWKAFSEVDHLNRSPTPSKLIETMTHVLKPLGAKFFCFNFLPRPGQDFEEVLLAHRIPEGWLRLYLERRFADSDPSLRHCKRTVYPFEYLDAPYDPETEPAAAEVFDRARDFGVSRGFLVPIAGPGGCEGDVWIGGPDLELAPQEKAILHFLCIYGFERLRQLTHRETPANHRLTAREREVLTWIAAGKCAWEIGEILNISKRTVDEHSNKAARKLNATNRTQAVALAVRDRLIEI